MSKSTPLMILTAAALFSGVAGAATRTTVKPAAAAVTTKPAAVAKPSPAKPVLKMATARPAPTGRMVSAKLSNGKTVTYNCSLAGNASKKACK